jgi:DNA-binding SARP family transcriptional activator
VFSEASLRRWTAGRSSCPPTRGPASCLARLALSPGPQPRSALAGRLRPDVPEESARKTLRNALYELRRALGPEGAGALEVSARHIGLSDEVRVDVRRFRRCLADGDLEGAAAAGDGVLLDGFDADWAQRARDEHAAELAGVLGTLAARSADAGDLGAAVGWARRRLDADPLAEAAHRELIRLLALSGDRPAALAAARTMGERLRSELGLPPSAATRALVEDVRLGRVGPAAAAPAPATVPPLPAALAAGARPEGRGPALARLERAWADAVSGTRRLRCCAANRDRQDRRCRRARAPRARPRARSAARAQRRARARAVQPWIEALERLLEALPAADADHWLTRTMGRSPAAARAQRRPRAGGQSPRALPRLRAGARAARGRRRAVARPARSSTTCSGPTRTRSPCCRHVARSAPGERLLVLLCARPAELEPAIAQTLAELRREGPLVHVDLAGLDDDAVAALLARRTGASDPETARRYRARSGGNPFFLEELLREAQEAGGEVGGPPAGVREVIARRLARLDTSTLRALDVAAVFGPRVRPRDGGPRGRHVDRRGARSPRRGKRGGPHRRHGWARALCLRPRARRRDDRVRAAGFPPCAAAPRDR